MPMTPGDPFVQGPEELDTSKPGQSLLNLLAGFITLPAAGLTEAANLLPGAQLPREDIQKLWDPSVLFGKPDPTYMEGASYPFTKIKEISDLVNESVAANTGYATPMEGREFGQSEDVGRDVLSQILGGAAGTATELGAYYAGGKAMKGVPKVAERIGEANIKANPKFEALSERINRLENDIIPELQVNADYYEGMTLHEPRNERWQRARDSYRKDLEKAEAELVQKSMELEGGLVGRAIDKPGEVAKDVSRRVQDYVERDLLPEDFRPRDMRGEYSAYEEMGPFTNDVIDGKGHLIHENLF